MSTPGPAVPAKPCPVAWTRTWWPRLRAHVTHAATSPGPVTTATAPGDWVPAVFFGVVRSA
jgi:hypothetical protein